MKKLLLLATVLLSLSSANAQTAYVKEMEKWRSDQESDLKKDDGWLTVAGLFVFRKRNQGDQAAILAAGYPFTPLAFLTLVAMLLVVVMFHSPRETFLGIVVVLAGIPAYEMFRRRTAAN